MLEAQVGIAACLLICYFPSCAGTGAVLSVLPLAGCLSIPAALCGSISGTRWLGARVGNAQRTHSRREVVHDLGYKIRTYILEHLQRFPFTKKFTMLLAQLRP